MTEDRPTPGDPDTAEQERVSRLLAASAAEARVPDDVAARLDSVLADLTSEASTDGREAVGPSREGSGDDARVTRLEQWRRRWPTVLVAAATVSVIALGVGDLMGERSGGDASVTADSADAGGSAGSEAAEPEGLAQQRSGEAAAVPPPRLSTASLAVDVRRLIALSPALPTVDGAEAAAWCVQPSTSAGEDLLRVRLDGQRAVLVLGRRSGGERTAEVFTCDDGDTPAAATTVTAP